MKRHVFFIILIGLVASGAAWLFQDTLKKELQKSFPSIYAADKVSTVAEKYHLSGEVKQKSPQPSDSDLKAELALNRVLRSADWIDSYEEISTEFMQIASFLGPDSAVKGYGTDAYYDNKDVDSNGSKYTTVQTVWMEEKLVEQYRLGTEAKQIFKMPNNYLEKIYVVLGANYKIDNGYRVGNSLKAQNYSKGTLQMQVVGFLPAGATAKIGDKEINLDDYILCPFISLQDIYEIKEEVPESYTDGIYIPVKLINEEYLASAYRNNPPNKKNDSKSGLQYAEVKGLFIEHEAVNEESPAWLKKLAERGEKETTVRVVVGANYAAAATITSGTVFDMYSANTLTKLQAYDVLEPGTTWKVYGMDVVLDDYIVFLQEEEKKEETTPQQGGTDNPEDPGNTDVDMTDEPYGPKERKLSLEDRAKLFHYQFMMNNGYLKTKLTKNEAQMNLAVVLEEAFRDFKRDNPKVDPLSSYRIEGSSSKNSILFRANAMDLTKKVLKFTKYGFPICMVLLLLYLFYKYRSGKEFYSSIYLTGTNRVEIMAMYLIEGILMVALAAALASGCAWVVCKLLKLKMSAPKPIIRRIIKTVVWPTVAIMVWILIRDFGRMFRRTQEV